MDLGVIDGSGLQSKPAVEQNMEGGWATRATAAQMPSATTAGTTSDDAPCSWPDWLLLEARIGDFAGHLELGGGQTPCQSAEYPGSIDIQGA